VEGKRDGVEGNEGTESLPILSPIPGLMMTINQKREAAYYPKNPSFGWGSCHGYIGGDEVNSWLPIFFPLVTSYHVVLETLSDQGERDY